MFCREKELPFKDCLKDLDMGLDRSRLFFIDWNRYASPNILGQEVEASELWVLPNLVASLG